MQLGETEAQNFFGLFENQGRMVLFLRIGGVAIHGFLNDIQSAGLVPGKGFLNLLPGKGVIHLIVRYQVGRRVLRFYFDLDHGIYTFKCRKPATDRIALQPYCFDTISNSAPSRSRRKRRSGSAGPWQPVVRPDALPSESNQQPGIRPSAS